MENITKTTKKIKNITFQSNSKEYDYGKNKEII